MKAHRACMLRNVYDWDCGKGTNFWEVINDSPWDISDLPSKTRNQVRRSLRDCDIRKITVQELIKFNGYYVFVKAFERYRDVAVKIPSREIWESTLNQNDSTDVWGVFLKETDTLIAWGINSIKDNRVYYNTLKAIPEMMNKHYPYFGLLYTMNNYYLKEQGYMSVSDGARSVTGHSNIQPFLEKNFLFRKAYCNMRLYYTWWLEPIIKILYPFRRIITYLPVKNILKFEEINRQCR